eukprot:6900471-Prymnesium_polylepis.1
MGTVPAKRRVDERDRSPRQRGVLALLQTTGSPCVIAGRLPVAAPVSEASASTSAFLRQRVASQRSEPHRQCTWSARHRMLRKKPPRHLPSHLPCCQAQP